MRLNFVESNASGDKVRSAHFLHGIDSRGKGMVKRERERRGGKRGEEVAQANVKFIYAYVCMYSLTLVSLYL